MLRCTALGGAVRFGSVLRCIMRGVVVLRCILRSLMLCIVVWCDAVRCGAVRCGAVLHYARCRAALQCAVW
jgi:hypothetical protein